MRLIASKKRNEGAGDRNEREIFNPLYLLSAWRSMGGGLWHCTRDKDQDHPQEKEMQKSKMAFWGSLTNGCEKKRNKRQRRKGKIHPFSQIEGFHLISTLLCFGSLKMVFYCLLVWIFLTKCLCFSFYLITYNVSFSFLLVRQYSLFHLFSEILSSCAFIQFYFVFLLGFLWIFLCLCV